MMIIRTYCVTFALIENKSKLNLGTNLPIVPVAMLKGDICRILGIMSKTKRGTYQHGDITVKYQVEGPILVLEDA